MNERYLRGLLVDDVTIPDLILAQSQLRVLDNGFQELGLETPEWVTDKAIQVGKEIVLRNEVELRRRLKAAMARRAALASPDEKRSALDAEIAALQQKLG